MTECEMFGCGSDSLWTREDLDELRSALNDELEEYNIRVDSMYLAKEKNKEYFDLDYCYDDGYIDFCDTLHKKIFVSKRIAPSASKLIVRHTSEIAEAIRAEVKEILDR